MEGMRASRDEQSGAEWRPPPGRWQPKDGQAMLAALVASGQTPSVFARARGFTPYRVSYWRARLGERTTRPPRSTGGGFVPVAVRDEVPVPDHHNSSPEPRVEVTLVNGRRVSFAGRWDAAAITLWLRAVEVVLC